MKGGKRGPGRPKEARLSREAILTEALKMLDRSGPEAFSMRRLAERLGVSAMATYNHFKNKSELLRAVAEQLAQAIDFGTSDGDWRERIAICFRQLRQACLEHPGVMRLMESIDLPPPAVFRPMEITLAALAEAGVAADHAIKGYFALMNFAMGQISYEVRGPFEGLDPAEAVRHRRLPSGEFAHIAREMPVGQWDFDAAFEFGLAAILAGIERLAKS